MGSSDLGPARWWCGTCCTRGSSVTQKEVSPDFWNHDSVKSSLPEPTFLLSFLTLSFSISSTLHLFPTHDDTILPTYPIQLFLLPIKTTRSTPSQQPVVYSPSQQQPVVYNSSQQQFVEYNLSQQLFVAYNPSQVAGRGLQPHPAAGRGVQPPPAAAHGVQPQPSAARGVQLQHAEREDTKGALGEEEKRRKIAQGSEYSMAGKFLPLQPSAARPRGSRPRAVYIVPSREIY